MKIHGCLGSIHTHFLYTLLLGVVLLCLTPAAAAAEPSVSFAGALTTLPTNGLSEAAAVAVDSRGDVFIPEFSDLVGELPRTGTGYGPVATLPLSGLYYPSGVAVDNAGDVFIADIFNNRVVELPRTGASYGPQTTLPFSGLYYPSGVSVDSAGDVFITDRANDRVVELPKTGTDYGPQAILSFSGLYNPSGVAVDSAGDVFVADESNNRVMELPKTATSYGAQITLPFEGLSDPSGVAVDSSGDVFVADSGNNRVIELPWMGTGYGPQTTVVAIDIVQEIGLDGAGDIFVAGTERVDYSFSDVVLKLQMHSVNFGSANVCAAGTTPEPCSQTQTLSYNVTASDTLGTPQIVAAGASDLDFALASGSTCTGTAGRTCIVNVAFVPLAAGTRAATVKIVDRYGTTIAKTPISGLGVAVSTGNPVAQLSTSYLRFDAIFFGTTETKPITITNSGGGTLTIEPSIGGSNDYTIAGNTCGAGVTTNQSCTLQVKFDPTSIRTQAGLLTVQTNGGDSTVDLHGGVVGLSVLGGVGGDSIEFGTVPSGSTEVLSLTVTNVGLPGMVTIGTAITARATTRPTSTYRVLTTMQNTCLAGIAPGQSCTLPMEFAPTLTGVHDDLLTLLPSAGEGQTTIWLTGSTP